MKLHFEMWMFEGSFEDIPEKDRDPELWEFFVRYSPVFLGLIWEGERPGREELLAAEVDFTRAYDDGYDIVGVRPYGAPGPNTPRKL